MGLISKNNTFSSGATIVASEHNANFDTLYDAVNGNLNNANIVGGAGIIGSKLDLSSPGTIGGSTASPGTFTNLTSTGDTTLGNATADDVTITGSIASSIKLKDETVDIGTTSLGLNDLHFGSGGIINWDGGDITLTHSANTLTLAGATTFDFGSANMTNVDIDSGTIDGVTIGASSAPTVTDLGSVATADINGGTIDGVTIGATSAPTVTDLGSVATCDINGGTLDGVQIAGATAHGEIFYNDASNNVAKLANGSSGQVLTSGGVSAPSWGTPSVVTLADSAENTSVTDSGDLTITSGKIHILNFHLQCNASTDTQVILRFNNDSTGSDYKFFRREHDTSANTDATFNSDGDTGIDLTDTSTNGFNNGSTMHGTIIINSSPSIAETSISGSYHYTAQTPGFRFAEIMGSYTGGEITSVEIIGTSAFQVANTYLYAYALS